MLWMGSHTGVSRKRNWSFQSCKPGSPRWVGMQGAMASKMMHPDSPGPQKGPAEHSKPRGFQTRFWWQQKQQRNRDLPHPGVNNLRCMYVSSKHRSIWAAQGHTLYLKMISEVFYTSLSLTISGCLTSDSGIPSSFNAQKWFQNKNDINNNIFFFFF